MARPYDGRCGKHNSMSAVNVNEVAEPDSLAGKDPSKSAIAKLIGWSIANQLIIAVLAIALAIGGWMSLKSMPLDAIPDLTDTQVIIRTEFPGQSPQIVEDLVTYPLSTNLLGLPKTKDVRGSSMFGTSFVYVIFEDSVDPYWARSRVVEALSRLGSELPRKLDLTQRGSAGSINMPWWTRRARQTLLNCEACKTGS